MRKMQAKLFWSITCFKLFYLSPHIYPHRVTSLLKLVQIRWFACVSYRLAHRLRLRSCKESCRGILFLDRSYWGSVCVVPSMRWRKRTESEKWGDGKRKVSVLEIEWLRVCFGMWKRWLAGRGGAIAIWWSWVMIYEHRLLGFFGHGICDWRFV